VSVSIIAPAAWVEFGNKAIAVTASAATRIVGDFMSLLYNQHD